MEEIKETVKEIFKMIDEDIRVDFSLEEENCLNINIKIKEPQSFIGEKGQTLADTETLLKKIVRKKTKDIVFVNLDINNYKKRKMDYLKELALEAAEEVSLTGIEKKFPPMSAYERRVVHMALSEKDDIETESVNEGQKKRVVVKRKS